MTDTSHKPSLVVGQRVKISTSGSGAFLNGKAGTIIKIERDGAIVVQVSLCTVARFRPAALTPVEEAKLPPASE